MSDADGEHDPLNDVAESFLERFRKGERPSLTEYARRHPELAERILRLFPALVSLEELGSGADQRGSAPQAKGLELPACLGEYRLLREVGRGGMGVVYEAVQESLGRHVALKVLPYHALTDPVQRERFRREARAAAGLHHTNIVPVFGVGEDRGQHYYAMQFIRGEGLDAVLKEVQRLRAGGPPNPLENPISAAAQGLLTERFGHRTGSGQRGTTEVARSDATPETAPPPDLSAPSGGGRTLSDQAEGAYYRGVARLGVQVAEALAHAHRHGVLHRDIKPANLLLDTSGTVWITDFGLAKAEGSDELTGPGDILGTLRYMAPERLRGQSDPRGDVYSLGMTLYEMLTLRPALADSDRARLIERVTHEVPPAPRRIDPRIPLDLETVVLKATAKDPASRYASAEELAEDLRRFVADRPVRARRIAAWERLWRWCRRNPQVAGLSASVALLLLVTAVTSTVLSVWLDNERNDAVKAKEEEHKQHVVALRERELREQAEKQATERRFDSFLASLARARAARLSREVGQRQECLKAVREAVDIAGTLKLGEDHLLELRNEAVACLALPDLRLERAWPVNLQVPHTPDFDPALTRYVVVDGQWGATLRNTADDRVLQRFPLPTKQQPWCAAARFGPDGRFLAVLYQFRGAPPRAYLWDTARCAAAPLFGAEVCHLEFLPEGDGFVTVGPDGSLGLYDLPSGRESKRLGLALAVCDGDVPLAVAGRRVLVGNRQDRTLRLVDLQTDVISALGTLPGRVIPRRVALSVDGGLAAVAGEDLRIYVYRLPGWLPLRTLEGHQAAIQGIAFAEAGDLLASQSWDGQTVLWDPLAGRKEFSFPGAFLRFGGRGRLAFVDQTRAGIWELIRHPEFTVLHQDTVGVGFSADGALLATTGDGLRLWDAAAARELAHLDLGPCKSAAFHPRGHTLCVSGGRGLSLLPLREETEAGGPGRVLGPPRLLWEAGPAMLPAACYNRDGRLLAVSRAVDGLTADPEMAGDRTVLKLPAPTAIALSPDGRWAASGAWNWAKVRVWDLTGQAGPRDLPGQSRNGQTCFVAFSPDGQWLVTSGAESQRFWRVGTWEPGRVLPRDRTEPSGSPLAFAPDGRLLAVCRSQRLVQLVETTTGRELATLWPPEPAYIADLCFSPDGACLAVAHAARNVCLWDLRAVRARLAELGLDWDFPPYPAPADPPGRLRILPEELCVVAGVERGSLEAEDLKITAAEDCEACVQDMAPWWNFHWGNGRQLFGMARRGGYVEVEVEVARAGNYRLDVTFTRAPDYGRLEIAVAGKKVGEAFDGYHDIVRPSGKVGFGTVALARGGNRIRFTVVGKNDRSSGYLLGIDRLHLTPAE
jgi:serine/threonine protein kinase/WD40 repeat protein